MAYMLATNTTYPSWGYMAEQGATTIWELWNGNTANPAMNSGNHVMLLGDFLPWCYENLAGIKSERGRGKVGFKLPHTLWQGSKPLEENLATLRVGYRDTCPYVCISLSS